MNHEISEFVYRGEIKHMTWKISAAQTTISWFIIGKPPMAGSWQAADAINFWRNQPHKYRSWQCA